MPNLNADTVDLLDELLRYVLPQGATDIVTELQGRIIKEQDSDSDEKHIGGVRPKKAPIVP